MRILTGWGPIPAVVSSESQTGQRFMRRGLVNLTRLARAEIA